MGRKATCGTLNHPKAKNPRVSRGRGRIGVKRIAYIKECFVHFTKHTF